MILRRALAQLVVGLAFGVAGAFVLSNVLWGSGMVVVPASDPLTYLAIIVLLSTVALDGVPGSRAPGYADRSGGRAPAGVRAARAPAPCARVACYASLGTSSGNPGNSCPSSGLPSTNDRLCLYIRSSDGAG